MNQTLDHSGAKVPPTGETALSGKDRVRVFISYRHADRNLANRLYELLQERHVAAWYDPLIPYGTDWREAIVKYLSTARVMVVLLSSDALESEELRKELAVAVQEDVPLLPVRLEDVKPRGAFAYELARSDWFDIFDDPASRLPELADFLRELVNNPHELSGNSEQVLQVRQSRWRKFVGLPRSFLYLTDNNTLLFTLFIFISAGQFLLYERIAEPLEQLTSSGIAPLTAFFYVLVVVSVGSPFILFLILKRDLGVWELFLLGTAAANTCLLILLVRNFFVWIRHRFLKARSTK
jgi:hypothetical protein